MLILTNSESDSDSDSEKIVDCTDETLLKHCVEETCSDKTLLENCTDEILLQQRHSKDTCSDKTLLSFVENRSSTTTDEETHANKFTSDKAPEGYISVFVPRPPMPLSSDYHKKQFIVNEVLCYI